MPEYWAHRPLSNRFALYIAEHLISLRSVMKTRARAARVIDCFLDRFSYVRHPVRTSVRTLLFNNTCLLCLAHMQDYPDSQYLSPEQGKLLVKLARQTLQQQLAQRISQNDIDALEEALDEPCFQTACGTFVTLTLKGQLRGCIGNLTSDDSIRTGIRHNAVNAAFHDPRFAPLSADDLEQVEIEVSILSAPQPLNYQDRADLLQKLRPHIDGVIVRKDFASATFLPQVWEQLPQPQDFLTQLCLKAGLAADAWKSAELEISTYQVQYFHEQG